MSGGSFNYLCYKQTEELMNQLSDDSDLRSMSDWLAKTPGCEDVAKETEDLILNLRAFKNRIEARLERLQPVWQDVEWIQSNDRGMESLIKSLKVYRGEK